MHRRRRVLEDFYWIGLGCVLIVLATLAFGGVDVRELIGDDAPALEARATEAATTVATVKGSVSPPGASEPRAAAKERALPDEVVVAAVRGDCWVSLRRGSAAGEVLFEGLLVRGRRARVRGDRIFVRLGAGENVRVTVGGKPRPVPPGTADMVVRRTTRR